MQPSGEATRWIADLGDTRAALRIEAEIETHAQSKRGRVETGKLGVLAFGPPSYRDKPGADFGFVLPSRPGAR